MTICVHQRGEEISPAVLREIGHGCAVALAGRNFSGRTHLLRCWTGLDLWEGDVEALGYRGDALAAYIGPEVYNSISGLAVTVGQELVLHCANGLGGDRISALAEQLRLPPLFDRNPFTLSGGEQTCLAITSALALQPGALAIDCPTEQLDLDLKMQLLKWMSDGMARTTATVIADNRLAEYENEFRTVMHLEGASKTPNSSLRLRFDPICPSFYPECAVRRPCTLGVDGVMFRYPKGPVVLREVSARLDPALYVLDGRNGVGKSTLAKLLCGVLKPNRGRILAGQTELCPWKRPGDTVAYHYQNPDLQLFSTSVEEEILAGPRALRSAGEELARRAEDIICAFGLSHVRGEHPLDLPFVIRKRVALAATLAMGRPWIILDEPTLGQDDAASEALASIIEKLLGVGVGIIVITHSVWFRQRLSARLLRLENGIIRRT